MSEKYIIPENTQIINEFKKLVNYVRYLIDVSIREKNTKEQTANTFRLRQINNSLTTIKKYNKVLNLENLKEFSQFPGIGKGTIDRIKEIINTGKLKELDDFKDEPDENKIAIEELESVVGIGRSTALDLINQGIKSVKQLKDKIKKGEIEVNEKILLGVKYYGIFKGDIPRNEITKIYKLLYSIVKQVNKSYGYDDDDKYIFEICGSYRREKDTSGDIDVLISKVNTIMDKEEKINHLELFINEFKKSLKKNDNKPLLVDDITDKNFETKYMGFSKYKNNPVRRIDVRFVPYDAYHSALLYFTGSADLNKKMRNIAKKMKLKLSEYGLTKEDGSKIPINSEHDVFKILKMEYLAPRLR